MVDVTTLKEIKEKDISLIDLERKLKEENLEVCDFKRYLFGDGESVIILRTCKKGD